MGWNWWKGKSERVGNGGGAKWKKLVTDMVSIAEL
jgi:hypothetical protein